MSPRLPDSSWKRSFRRRLLAWYRRRARDLPWRRTRDPYAIWVSEIMLQQTQVATVIPYFERFLATFPTVDSLAAAAEEDVLRLWEGLGYYRRARQLHRAAKHIVKDHGGNFPRKREAVERLPGIGRYTAGAILSIAWDAREAILEANTIRLLSRLLAYQDDPRQSAGQRVLWGFASAILPRTKVGEFNQALMELGSEVCTPRAPLCAGCPLTELCPTHQRGWQERIPVAAKKTNYENVREAAVVVWRDSRVLIRQCQDLERWAGLWDFPRFTVQHQRGDSLRRELSEKVTALTGVQIVPGDHLTTIKYGVTRFRITLACYEAAYLRGGTGNVPLRWLRPAALMDMPLSVTGRKLSNLVLDGTTREEA